MHVLFAGRALPAVLLASALVGLAGPRAAADPAAPPVLPDVLTLSWCLERARVASPTLAGVEAEAEAAQQRARSEGSLDDPRFAYEASNIPTGALDFDSTPLSGHQLGLRQKLPLPGLLSGRREAARRASDASRLRVEDERLRTDGAVERAWAELAFAEAALRITERNIVLLRQLAATAESRYRVGSGSQPDVLRAQVELTALLQERLRLTESLARSRAALAELLDLPLAAELPPSGDLRMAAAAPDLEALVAALEERSARLAAARERVAAAAARVRVAKREGWPDVDLGVGYRVRQAVAGDPVAGDDFLSAGFTIRLPVDRGKWRAQVAAEEAGVRRAEAGLRSVRAALLAETRRAHAALVRATAEERLLETGLVPQARQSLEASRFAYEVGRSGLLDLLDSQVRLLGAELRLARARADKRAAFASLEVAAGEKLR